MAISLEINGQTYLYPEVGDVAWGPDATDWAVAVTSGMLQKAGGLFQLLAETDFGTSYGLKSLYYKSRTTNPAAAGQIRLARADNISWRNEANDGDLALSVNSSNALLFNGVAIGNFVSVTDTNSIDLTLTSGALTADLKLSAVTASANYTLVDLNIETDGLRAQIADSAIRAAISVTDTSTIDLTYAAGVLSADIVALSITNSLIGASAAIAFTKMATMTASRAVVSDGSGFLVPATTTATEIGYVNGVTSAIQTQIDAKAPKASPTFTGTVLLQNVSGAQPVLALSEDPDNGTDTVSIQAPASLAASYTLTLPPDDGAALQFLQTDGSGVLNWSSAAASVRPNIRATEGAGTTTLTSSDNFWQIFDLSAGRTLVLPTTGIVTGDTFTIENRANFLLTIQSSNGSEITTAAGASGNVGTASIFKGVVKIVATQNTPTTPAHWLTIECQEEGQYTPTITSGANVGSTTAYSTNFIRNNGMVTVSGRVDIDATASGFALTVIDISLPKASNLTTQQQLSGTSTTSDSGVGMGAGFVFGNTTNDRAILNYNSTTSLNKECWFQFMYVMV